MTEHLGNFVVDNAVLLKEEFGKIGSETIIDRIKNITLYFLEVNIPVHLTQISNLKLLPNDNIYIKGCLFSPSLYHAYAEHYTIIVLRENGLCVNPIDNNTYRDYEVKYYNYKFKEFSFSRMDNEYSFILEPIEEV